MIKTFDAIVIGAGQAGPSLAGCLTAAGMSVALIERKLIGGTCVNTGCTPTKTLIASAYAAQMARRASDYGLTIGRAVGVDMKKVKARKDAVSGNSRTGLETWLKRLPNCTVYEGHARFETLHNVRVGDELLSADRIFLNVGGRALVPDMAGLDQVNFFTNTSMLDLDVLPRHLVIVGRARIRADVPAVWQRGDRR
jgi:pyruvate/2-oxoglutarate dehydrogenase complex dihydrolipoamide dehydrogenase (E3) component